MVDRQKPTLLPTHISLGTGMADAQHSLNGVTVNISPDAFKIGANHFYKCKQDFVVPDSFFSLVPYFLLCRAIELKLKSIHLAKKTQPEVKNGYGHNLILSYESLDSKYQLLLTDEVDFLRRVSAMYKSKEFEYFYPIHALTGFTQFPNLEELDRITKKIIDIGT